MIRYLEPRLIGFDSFMVFLVQIFFIIALLLLFVPVLNIIEVIVFGVLLTIWCHDGLSLAGSNPVSKFFKMLNRDI